MTTYYALEIQSFPNGEICERYEIGVFQTRLEAEETAKRYLSEIPGFKDYYCEYTIHESALIGTSEEVYNFTGWDRDDEGNEINIYVSPLYADRRSAEQAMDRAQSEMPRQEWCMNDWSVGKCEWSEGFTREYPDGSIAPTLAELRENLQALSASRSVCGIEFEYSDHAQYYFPVAVGEGLFLSAVDDDFMLNGFTVRRLRDIFDLDSRKGIYQTIAEKEGLTDFVAPDVDITNWQTVFASLQKHGRHIIVEREYEPDFFRLGVIESVGEAHVIFRHYDADGIWQEPRKINYREITSVTFDDRYANTFSKYLS